MVDVLVTTLKVRMMTPQTSVVSVELLLDDVVLLPQTMDQGLVVGSKELEMLPMLTNFLFKTISLKMPPC